MPATETTLGWQRLAAVLVAIAIIWGAVLPRLERTRTVQARIKHLDDHGINPAALFYSDHEGMQHWEGNILGSKRQNPQAYW